MRLESNVCKQLLISITRPTLGLLALFICFATTDSGTGKSNYYCEVVGLLKLPVATEPWLQSIPTEPWLQSIPTEPWPSPYQQNYGSSPYQGTMVPVQTKTATKGPLGFANDAETSATIILEADSTSVIANRSSWTQGEAKMESKKVHFEASPTCTYTVSKNSHFFIDIICQYLSSVCS